MRNKITVLSMLLLALCAGCVDKQELSENQIRSLYKNSAALNDAAAFLSGTTIGKKSPLYPMTQKEEYIKYRAAIDGIWEQYKKNNLANIEKWRVDNIKFKDSGIILYPFSGPDILNALAFFPDAGEFVMVGLELPGTRRIRFIIRGQHPR